MFIADHDGNSQQLRVGRRVLGKAGVGATDDQVGDIELADVARK